jgi:hypothetical protein
MQKSSLISALTGALLVGAIGIFLLAVVFEMNIRRLNRLQPALAQQQANAQLVNALAMDCLEYSKHNPAIDPVLVQAGIKPAGIAAKPAAK